MFAQQGFVVLRGAAEIGIFRLHAVNIRQRNGNAQQQLAAGHAVIARGIIGRDGALVAPEDVDLDPIDLTAKLGGGQQAIEFARRGAAGKRHVEAAVAGDGLPGAVDKAPRGGAGHLVGIRIYPNARQDFAGLARTYATGVHRAPGVCRLRRDPSFPRDNWGNRAGDCSRPKESDRPVPRRPPRYRRGRREWRRRA